MTDEQSAEIAKLMATLEFDELFGQKRASKISDEDFSKKVMAMMEAGRVPEGEGAWAFWFYGVFESTKDSDKAMATKALDKLATFSMFETGRNKTLLETLRKGLESDGEDKDK